MKRNVSFSSLEIRSYNVTLGDAPTASGPPVTLSWEYNPTSESYDVDRYIRVLQGPEEEPEGDAHAVGTQVR